MPRTVELQTSTAEDTRAAAGVVASVLVIGDVVSLTGELGAGKTCFAQGVAAALGVQGPVTSPTFVLRRDYAGSIPLTHFDVYRLERFSEVLDAGFGETEGVVLVEWGDAMRPLLPPDHLEVEILLADPRGVVGPDGDEPRLLRLAANGDSWQRRLAELGPRLAPWRTGTHA